MKAELAVRRSRLANVAPLAAGIIVVLALASGLASAWSRTPSSGSASHSLAAGALVKDFFARYVTADGRVVREDQGGDTVSEGQAYALLMAAATGPPARFDKVWGWTKAHLQQSDGLFAWHWADGRVTGANPATDADLGIAAALTLGAGRFGRPAYLAAAGRIQSAIVSREVISTADGPVLTAGPWVDRTAVMVNPSYLADPELAALARAFHGPWDSIQAQSQSVLESLVAGGTLPPDWAIVGSDGQVHPTGPPGTFGSPVRFGFDAARTPLWMAASCSPTERAAAAALLPALERGRGRVGLDLGGNPSTGTDSPMGMLAVAGGLSAGGSAAPARSQLQEADAANRMRPTYYASAWVALTALVFDHDLGTC